jgi:hypothetical protein
MSDEQNPIDSKTLDSLRREQEPSMNLETKIVNALKSEGLIQEPRISDGPRWRMPAVAAIVMLLFAGGYWMGRQSGQKSLAEGSAHPLFALFLYEPAGKFNPGSGHVQEYTQWVRSVRVKGRFADGEKLKDGGRKLEVSNGTLKLSAAPLQNQQMVMGGYFLIEAANYEEAVRIASGCPHLKYGGIIEVRQIDAT